MLAVEMCVQDTRAIPTVHFVYVLRVDNNVLRLASYVVTMGTRVGPDSRVLLAYVLLKVRPTSALMLLGKRFK